ncbi:MAG: HAD family hydrolase [Dehalococcoidia bacterium]
MQADTLIFDLDGTLWDTNATCAIAWNRVLARLEVDHPPVTEAQVRAVAGRSHRDAIAVAFPTIEDEALLDRISAETELEDNIALAEVGGRLFEGVLNTIPRLAEAYRLMIVSNCQAGYIEVFRTTSGLDAHFEDHECWGNTGRTKTENLALIIERNEVARPVFVGDTTGDLEAARNNEVPFVHAAYGFGTVEAPDATIDAFPELVPLLTR